MIYFTAISTILTFFLSMWCLTMTRNPRNWRLWWMSHLRQIDMNSTSQERRHQDGIFRMFVLTACILSVLATAWGGYWTWAQWSEGRQHSGHVNDGVFIEQDAANAKAGGLRR